MALCGHVRIMATRALARCWSACGRRRMQSHTAGMKETPVCCNDTAVVKPFLMASVQFRSVHSLACGEAHHTKEAPSRVSAAAVPALGSLLRPRCAQAVHPHCAVADTVQTPVEYHCSVATFRTRSAANAGLRSTLECYKRSATIACRFGAARYHSTTAAAGEGSCCLPVREETAEHFPKWSSVEKQRCAVLLKGSKGHWRRPCLGAGFLQCNLVPSGRGECEGRRDDELVKLHQQRPAAVSCSRAWNRSGRSKIQRVPTICGLFPPDSLVVPRAAAKPACGAAQRLRCMGSSQRRTLLRVRTKDTLDQLRHPARFAQRRGCPSGDGVLCDVYLTPGGVYTVASQYRQSRHLPMTPRVSSAPAGIHTAGRHQQPLTQLLRALVQRQPCRKIVVDVRQIPELAAAASASHMFFRAGVVTGDGHWATAEVYQSSAPLCRDSVCRKEDVEAEPDKQSRTKEARLLLCHKRDGNVKELNKVRRGKTWNDPLVMHPLSEFFRQFTAIQFQSSTPPAARDAGETGSATKQRKSFELESAAARRVAGRAPSEHAAVRTPLSEKPPPHGGTVAEVAATATLAAPTAMCIRATRKTGAAREGNSAAATGNLARAAEAATESSGVGETRTVGRREIMERRELLIRNAVGERGWRLQKDGTSAAPENPIVEGLLPGFIWHPGASLTTQVMGRWKVADQRQQQQACHFVGAHQFRCGWKPFAPYSSCSAATAEAPGKGAQSSRTPIQLSRKELRGLQGHPRRYQLMGGRPEFHNVDRNKNGHIVEPTDKFQVVITTSKNNVHVQVLNKSRAYRTIFGSFAGNVGYRKRAQQEPQCAYRVGQNIARKCRRLGIYQVDVKFRRIMRVEQLLQAFAAHGLGVTSITHEPRLPKCGQNSTKPRKRRRV